MPKLANDVIQRHPLQNNGRPFSSSRREALLPHLLITRNKLEVLELSNLNPAVRARKYEIQSWGIFLYTQYDVHKRFL